MIRNGGILGKFKYTTPLNSSGIYDLHDQLIIIERGEWQETLKVTSLTPSTTNVSENSSMTFTVTTSGGLTGIENFTLYWTISGSGISSGDFVQGISGSFTVSSGSGVITITPIAEGTTENETFTLTVRSDSTSGPILATSDTITITDAVIPGQDITSQFVEISNRHIDSDLYMGSSADYNGPYDVAEIQTNFSGGNGRVYIGFKVTSATTFYSDLPVAGVQVLNSSKNVLLHSWIFWSSTGGSGSAWATTTTSVGSSTTAGLFGTTPASASGRSYSGISASATANRFCWATSTSSAYTGAAGGISSAYVSSIMPTAGNARISQVGANYYAFVETSGSTRYQCHVMRSPLASIPSGSWIRIAHAVTGLSSDRQDPFDCLYVAVF